MRRFIQLTQEDIKGIHIVDDDNITQSVGVDENSLKEIHDEELKEEFNEILALYNEFDQYKDITIAQESMDADTAYLIGLRLEDVKQRLHLSIESIAGVSHFENPYSAKAATTFAIESIGSALRKIWKALKEAFLKVWRYIKNFFVRLFNGDARYKHRIQTLDDRIKNGGFGYPKEKTFSSTSVNEAFSSEGKVDPSFAIKILDNHIRVLKKSRESVRKLDGIYSTVDRDFATIKSIVEDFISNKDNVNAAFIDEPTKKSKLNYFANSFDSFTDILGAEEEITEVSAIIEDFEQGSTTHNPRTTPRLINNKAFYIVFVINNYEDFNKIWQTDEDKNLSMDVSKINESLYVSEYTFAKEDTLGDPDEVPVLNGTYITSIHSKFKQLNELLDKYDYENIINKIESKVTKYFDDYEKLHEKFYNHFKDNMPKDDDIDLKIRSLKNGLTEIEKAFYTSRRFMKEFYSILIEVFHNVMRQHLQARDIALSWVEESLSYYNNDN